MNKNIVFMWFIIALKEGLHILDIDNMLFFWLVELLFSIIYLIPMISLYMKIKNIFKYPEYVVYFLYGMSSPVFYISWHLSNNINLLLYEHELYVINIVLGITFLTIFTYKLIKHFINIIMDRIVIKK